MVSARSFILSIPSKFSVAKYSFVKFNNQLSTKEFPGPPSALPKIISYFPDPVKPKTYPHTLSGQKVFPCLKNHVLVRIFSKVALKEEFLEISEPIQLNYSCRTEKIMFCKRLYGKCQIKIKIL